MEKWKWEVGAGHRQGLAGIMTVVQRVRMCSQISQTEDNRGSWKVGGEKSQPRRLEVCMKRVPHRYRLERSFLWDCA